MNKLFFKLILIIVLSFTYQEAKAQSLDSLTLDTMQAFVSIQEAMKNPIAVIKLSLRKQHLKSFPKEIFQFKNLQYLDISKNSISELPDSIGLLANLQYFACSKTGLKRLPKDIGKLVNLKYLNLNQNDLETIPTQIGNLEKLEILDLWSNNFDEYPSTFSSLKSLRVLDLRNILISDEVQKSLTNMLPRATVYMSPSCKCKW
ncbi:MAG: leucine-rich repeat domain-containing protein [Burkholderiales bacterium]|nr:leucine-rich repeat domain-containing protein [Bacteroidia bacterium]